jgi:hypothetical protein
MTLDEHFLVLFHRESVHISSFYYFYIGIPYFYLFVRKFISVINSIRVITCIIIKYKNTFSGTSIRMLSSIYNSVPVKS